MPEAWVPGYPQLRVALARQIAVTEKPRQIGADSLSVLRAETNELARTLPDSLGMLTSEVLDTAITAIVDSRRLLCVANGLSAPLAIDLAMRLTAAGRSSEFIADALGQQVAARQLTRDDAVVVISGSCANELSLRVAHAATIAGATVVAVTSFAASPLVNFADITLVIASVHASFQDELEHTSRIAHAVFLHSLIPPHCRAPW